jgi:hypothetical protein
MRILVEFGSFRGPLTRLRPHGPADGAVVGADPAGRLRQNSHEAPYPKRFIAHARIP